MGDPRYLMAIVGMLGLFVLSLIAFNSIFISLLIILIILVTWVLAEFLNSQKTNKTSGEAK